MVEFSDEEISSNGEKCPPVEIKVEKVEQEVKIPVPTNLRGALIRTTFFDPHSSEFHGAVINALSMFFGVEIPDEIYYDNIWLKENKVKIPKMEEKLWDDAKEIFERYPHTRKLTVTHNTDKIKEEVKGRQVGLHRKLSKLIHDQLKRSDLSEEMHALLGDLVGRMEG